MVMVNVCMAVGYIERVRKSWLPNHGHGKRMYGSGVHRERELGRAGFRIMVMVNACMAVGYIERES